MIDKSGEYWKSETAEDIDEYLREYSDDPALDVKPIVCKCGSEELYLNCEQDEGVPTKWSVMSENVLTFSPKSVIILVQIF